MKKILVALMLCMVSIMSFTSCDSVTVKDGKGNKVKINVENHLISDFIVNNKACWYKNEINTTVEELHDMCKYPPTFSPTSIKLTDSPDMFGNYIYVEVEVTGYAKNGFGVEDIVKHSKTFIVTKQPIVF